MLVCIPLALMLPLGLKPYRNLRSERGAADTAWRRRAHSVCGAARGGEGAHGHRLWLLLESGISESSALFSARKVFSSENDF